MITLNVISINGNTDAADATYGVSERQVYDCYANPSNAAQSYVEIEAYGRTQRDVLLVSDTLANILTTLNGGLLLKVFLIMTVKKIGELSYATPVDHILNMENIVTAYDQSSDGFIEYAGENNQWLTVIQTDQTISTISAAAADISPGAETIVYPLTSKTVFAVDEVDRPFPIPFLINQKYVEREFEDYKNSLNTTATGRVKLKLETVVAIINAGTGYQVNDDIQLQGGTGTLAVIKVATVGGGGDITGVTVVPATTGSYFTLPSNIAAVPVVGGNGSGAVFSIDFEVESIFIDEAGEGYATAPTVTISGGGGAGATATATLSGDSVLETTITAPGNNFTSIPTVAFTAPPNKTAWEVRPHQAGITKLYIF